jgi:hypothetical protein
MNAALTDAAGIAGAAAILAPLIVLPGATIAAALDRCDNGEPQRPPDMCTALLLGIAVLPALVGVLSQIIGLAAALGFQAGLAILGLLPRIRPRRFPLTWCLPIAIWIALVIATQVDFEFAGRLYHSALVRDLAKHAATVNTLVTWNVPLVDPFYLRPAPGAYYYFAHILATLPVRATAGIIDARASMAALIILCGIGLFALALFTWQRCHFASVDPSRIAILLLILLLARNLDILPALSLIAAGEWPVDIERWNEQILSWLFSCLWVPQHVVALIAGSVALFMLADRGEMRRHSWFRPLLAGVAFASCVGASVWVGFGVGLAAAFWLASLCYRRCWAEAIYLVSAGAIAAALLVPLGLEFLHGRAGEAMPVQLGVRGFLPIDRAVAPGPLRQMLDFLFLPLNYLFELGVFGIGAVVFWRQNGWRHGTEAARILTLCALSGLLLGSFARSVIINNDLGWRVMLLTQFAALIWTAAAIVHAAEARGTSIMALLRWPARLGLLALLGYAGNLYNLVSIRAYPAMGSRLALFDRGFDRPELDREMRDAYRWLNANLPREAVVQHNPAGEPHIYNFGLASRHRVAVGDSEAALYGAPKSEVQARLEAISRVFTAPLPADAVRAEAIAQHIDVLIVASADPVWNISSSWVWTTRPVYKSSLVRLLAVSEIGEEADIGEENMK